MNKKILYAQAVIIGIFLAYSTMMPKIYVGRFIALTIIFSLFYIGLLSFYPRTMKKTVLVKWEKKLASAACSILLSTWVVFSFVTPKVTDKTYFFVVVVVLELLLIIFHYLLFVNVRVQVKTLSHSKDNIFRSWPFRLGIVAGLSISNVAAFVAYYPGSMMTDSVWQWQQIQTGVYSNWHPVVDTLIMKLCYMVWDSPASYAILQSIVFIGVMSTILIYFYERSVATWQRISIVIISFATMAFPLFSIMNQFITKDSLDATMGVLLTFIIYLVLKNPDFLKHWWNCVFVACVIFFFVSLRSNSLPAFIGFEIISVIFMHSKRFISWHATAILVILIHLILTGPIYKTLNVEAADSSESFGVPTQIIAGVYNHNGSFTANERRQILTIMPDWQWRTLYNPLYVDPFKFNARSTYNREYIRQNLSHLFLMTLKVSVNNPELALNAYYNQTMGFWKANVGTVDLFTSYDSRATDFTHVPGYWYTHKIGKKNVPYYIPGWNVKKYGHLSRNFGECYRLLSKEIYSVRGLQFVTFPATVLQVTLLLILSLLFAGKWRKVINQLLPILIAASLWIGIPAEQFRYYLPFYMNLVLMIALFVFEIGHIDNDLSKNNI